MSVHRFACGQRVTFSAKRVFGPSWSGAFVIVKLLPSGGEAPRYEIKSIEEAHTRAASEDQLSALEGDHHEQS
jgi:hypothetical protein